MGWSYPPTSPQQIHSGRLQPGRRLPPLRIMAEHYGICVATARSALKVLQAVRTGRPCERKRAPAPRRLRARPGWPGSR
ncbi:GntR family transcriptional regulator [Streptomyces sp. NPDC032472]|uniref:GntR family transcriptional regulator n=1 Tax=Streptomyces sp. NPDC032472 TaxID=3155018 RepID=UPI0033DADF46